VNDAGGQPLRGDPAARVLVAGASGFAGALAAQIVWNHPRLQLVQVSSRSEVGTRLDRLYPRYRVPLELRELDLESIEDTDAAIVAYPHGASAPVVAEARGLGLQVVDLSADFRLRDVPTYEKWYGPHSEPDLLVGAAYGLPELNRERIRTADLVANPGCYPTAALLALAPLAEQDLISDVVIDAKQGISGAGRGGGDDEMHFVNLSENAMAYKVDAHRHSPEIEQELRELGFSAPVTFVPHLLPIDQGELASCYVTTTREVGEEELDSLYRDRWQDEPFVKLVDSPPGVRDVRDSNDCHLFVTRNGPKVVALAAIDNLWKGAAGQAVQNLNLMLDLPETEGLR
jgi:N-acetyl-gamma-glutamyl-phosphate reductase